ncbi:DUF982 domain-containing protein [Rhizobium leguminosarum]|uniref:DUF982 domain-containing protein n=1 Tax=Rhizobium leguminosarum TaxID=384 RepID=UPI0021BC2DEA|nr:DUF982 domain-containing protein [Rhizobium leguminosarum]
MLMLVFEDREAYKIKTLHDMANVLLNLWPDEGDAYVIAVKACLDAKFGDVSRNSRGGRSSRLRKKPASA